MPHANPVDRLGFREATVLPQQQHLDGGLDDPGMPPLPSSPSSPGPLPLAASSSTCCCRRPAGYTARLKGTLNSEH